MGYEYEHELLNYASDSETYEKYENMLNEIKNVYAKAKAFDEIRNVDKDFYKEYGYYPNEEEWWYDASNIIEKYEELHGGRKQ